MKWALLFCFGGVGVISRVYLNEIFGLPLSTFFVNVLGSFLIGVLSVSMPIPENLKIALMAGLLGGLTTFSGYSMDGLRLLESQRFLQAGLYLMGSMALGIFFCWVGIKLGKTFI